MLSDSEQVWRESCRLAVLGTAQAYPGEAVSTGQLLEMIDRRFGLTLRRRGLAIARKLNIQQRHVARDFAVRGEGTCAGCGNHQLAARAVREALRAASLSVHDLGYLIGHTATPGQHLPANVALVARELGYRGPFAEFRQACTGFINALLFARGLLAAPQARPVAIVGSETGSVFFDPPRAAEDAGQLVNLVQMGDGAGAIILGAAAREGAPTITHLYHGQAGWERTPGLGMPTGGSLAPAHPGEIVSEFEHDFAAIGKHGLDLLLRGCAVVRESGVDLSGIDWILPHQANGRMDHYLREHLPVGGRVFGHADRVGNTGSAAIWLAFDELGKTLSPGAGVLVLGAEATQYMYGGFVYEHGAGAPLN